MPPSASPAAASETAAVRNSSIAPPRQHGASPGTTRSGSGTGPTSSHQSSHPKRVHHAPRQSSNGQTASLAAEARYNRIMSRIVIAAALAATLLVQALPAQQSPPSSDETTRIN